MLGQAVTGGYVGILIGLAEGVLGGTIFASAARIEEGHRRLRLARVERVGHRRLHRLVVLGEWTIDHRGREQPTGALSGHDEWQPGGRVLGVRLHGRRIIRHIAHPFRLGCIPLDRRAGRIPRIPGQIGGCSVVHHAPV